jgi:hypothetical protein
MKERDDIPEMNYQGCRMLGMDFATNYGKEIKGCFQFMFQGYEISVSSGAYNSARKNNHFFPEPVLVTYPNGHTEAVNGTVEDAIQLVLKQLLQGLTALTSNND